MKRFLLATTLALATSFAANAADVGVSISIGQPGFYGQIDIGDYPRPRLQYSQPRIVQQRVAYEPIYLRVRPGHARQWKQYCGEYNACNRRVYFVQDSWYDRVYVPRYRERHHDRRIDRGDSRRDDRDDDHNGKRGKRRGNDDH